MFRGATENNTENNFEVRFKKICRIGRGTFASVYKAIDTHSDTTIAMKKFSNDSNEGVHEITLREIGLLKIMDHPNIVKIENWNSKFNIFTMKMYDKDLKIFIHEHFVIPSDMVKDISYQIGRGIYYLHSHGIAHRDLKPQNIMVNHDTTFNIFDVVIIDMGLGRQLDMVDRECPKTQHVCTLWYRSPDILLGYKHYHYDLDIWSYGCIVGELLTKKPVFPGDSEIDQLYKIFKVLGTPNEETWVGVEKLPDYTLNFPQWKSIFVDKYKDYDPVLIDLLKTILVLNPVNRPDISKILRHIYFEVVPGYLREKYDSNVVDLTDSLLDNMTNHDIPSFDTSVNEQSEITVNNRMVLLDWMVEVCSNYNLSVNTYIRAQNIIDLYMMSCKTISKKVYQLVGMAAIWIASKIEDIYYVSLSDLIYISDHTYIEHEMIDMEREILRTINLELYTPITIKFLSFYTKQMGLSKEQILETEIVLMYITYNIELMKYHPSVLCLCVCLYVTRQTGMAALEISDDLSECMDTMKTWLDRGFVTNIDKLKGVKRWNNRVDLSRYN